MLQYYNVISEVVPLQKMERLSSAMEQQNQEQYQIQHVQWRRDKVQELCSKGYSQREVSQILQVGNQTESELQSTYEAALEKIK